MAQATSRRLVLNFALDNAAFQDGQEPEEIAFVLDSVSRRIKDGRTEGQCMDSNGNTVGRFEIREEPLS